MTKPFNLLQSLMQDHSRPMNEEEQFQEQKQARETGGFTQYGRIMQDRYNRGRVPPAPGQLEQEDATIERLYGQSPRRRVVVHPSGPLGNQADVDTRFDSSQVSAGSGNTLMEDARLKNPAAIKALTDYLIRGGR